MKTVNDTGFFLRTLPPAHILQEVDTKEGPLVILQGGVCHKRAVLHHLLTGKREPLAVPFQLKNQDRALISVSLDSEIWKRPLRRDDRKAFDLSHSCAYDLLQHGDQWLAGGGDSSVIQTWEKKDGQIMEVWVTPWVRPLEFDGNFWLRPWKDAARNLILLCEAAVIPILTADMHSGYKPSKAACLDPSLCEAEIAEFKEMKKVSHAEIQRLQSEIKDLVQDKADLANALALAEQNVGELRKQLAAAQSVRTKEDKRDEEIRRLRADLATARSQIKGVDLSRI